MKRLKGIGLILLVTTLMFNMSLSNLAKGVDNDIFFIENTESITSVVEEDDTSTDNSNNDNVEEETEPEEELIETTTKIDFIEETSDGQNINDYEKEVLHRIYEMENSDVSTSIEIEESKNDETIETKVLESLVADIVLDKIDSSSEIIEEEFTANVVELENISTPSEIENAETNYETEENEFDVVATISEIKDKKEFNSLSSNLFGSGNHTSTASPSIVINSTYDRYEIYTGENAGTVRIFDDNGIYYNSNTKVKVIRDMMDTNNNSPILLNLASNVQFFDFDNSNDNYVLLPDGFVEDLIARESGNGYLNPQGISLLDHIKVDLTFNSTNLGRYDLFEYGVLYYLSCYEGVLGEYYYYDPNTTDVDRAASFYVNNRIMNRTYNIVSEYYYKSPSGEQLSFKPTWIINNDNLSGANKENYAKQWVNFPYFLIKTGEKYWNLRDSIEQSTYLSEYAEGYYEQYLTEQPYGNVAERLAVLDDIYKTEADLLNDNTSIMTVHPYVKSSAITITGNFREDTFNEENKLRASGTLPYDTYAVLNAAVSDIRAKSVQVYLNGEKLITNNNHGLYTLVDGKCSIRIQGSALLAEENSRNVVSLILLDEEGNYLTDNQGRIVNSYITLIRNSTILAETYSITYVTNGGTAIPNSNVEEGNKLSLPVAPSKDYCSFMGWYTDSEFHNRFDANEYIISDKTLYALWRDTDTNVLDINGAARNCIIDRKTGLNYQIVNNYDYTNLSGDITTFRRTWGLDSNNLSGVNRENYVRNWVNFPYFLIKTGEKYWETREVTVNDEALYQRLLILDDIYRTEESLMNSIVTSAHPYVKSDAIRITGNFRADTITEENKLRAGGVLPYNTYAVINLNVTERRAKSVQVYLNGEKLISNNNRGLYALTNGKCQLRIDGSKLFEEENSRNVISFILLNDAGDYVTDSQNRIMNSYISLIRSVAINRTVYTISFNTNGGSSINSVNVEEGNLLNLPSNPIKDNKNFLGWYNDTSFQDKFDQNEYITRSKVLYALWGDIVYVPRSTGGHYSGGGSGGGGGGGGGRGGGLHAGGVATPLNGMGTLPLNVTSGNFIQIGTMRVFQDENGNVYRDKWAYIDTSDENGKSSAWYRFDQLGNPMKGFYSENSKVYYFDEGILNPKDEGKMVTGWKILYSNDGYFYWYYFNEDGVNESKGVLLTSGMTKDGYTVDANGRWTVNGVPQQVDLSKYKQ